MEQLLYEYDDLAQFYEDAIRPTEDGTVDRCKSHLQNEEIHFRGASIAEITDRKFCYSEGLDSLKELDLNLNLGGSKHTFKYDELDGDDINYDRLIDGFPAMRKRMKTHGIGSGRLINVYVVVSENCNVTAKNMLCKAYASIQIVDLLENLGYRVAVWSCDAVHDYNGSYKGVTDIKYELRVCLKKHEDALNKGLILNGISPWFFRYFMFAHQMGRYKVGFGLGRAINLNIPDTKENIVINHGECLSQKSVNEKIEKIIKLFEVNLDTLCNKLQLL